jgi:transforming growth factor-beta-induced protein
MREMPMRHRQLLGFVLSATLSLGLFTACDDDDVDIRSDPGLDIVQIASASPDLEVFTASLQRAGLTGALSGTGPYTVFAPTDEAFDRLTAGTLEGLSEDQLETILLYHVVDGRFEEDALQDGTILMNAGYTAFLDVNGDTEINDVEIIDSDITASNGVIHVIDEVLLPPDIIRALELADDFDDLLSALDRADLTNTLRGQGPFTVFAPTDDAFDELPDDLIDDLSDQQLRDVLLYHVIDARVLSTDLSAGAVETMLDGEEVEVELSAGDVRIQGARVLLPDIRTTNGVIHVIDTVLQP